MKRLLQSIRTIRSGCANRTTSRYLRLFSPMLLALAGVLFLLLPLSSSTISLYAETAETALFTDSGQELGNDNSTAVAMGDLDGDGDIDAFVVNGLNSDQSNEVWLNDGMGHFSDSGQSLGNSTSTDVALGDLDGDGDLDAFVANTSVTDTNGQPSEIWLNDGTGHFTDSGQSLPPSASSDVALGDLDGDGDLDAFVSNGYFSENSPYVQPQPDRVWLNDGTAHFTLGTPLPVSASISTAVTLGDVDGDGDLDAFVMGAIATFFPVPNIQPNNKLLLNNGNGSFSDSGQNLPIPLVSKEIALADLDGDGDLDAFVALFQMCVNIDPFGQRCFGERADQVWRNDGNGNFSDSGQRLGTSDSLMVALEDLDGDGDQDAFVANGYVGASTSAGKENEVWLNNGTGTFTERQLLGNSTSAGVALADVDGDGDLDGFVANISYNELWLNESGHFYENSQSLGDSKSYDVALGDLDGDGDLDAIVGNSGQPNEILLNNGDGILTESQGLGNDLTQAVALGDLDGDYDLDLFVGNNGANQVWLNDGQAQFTNSNQSLGESDTWHVALGDLDGDGDLDAFIGNRGGPNEVWLNDGHGQFTDSGQNLGNFRSYGVALGDLDEDGDLDAFVANNRGPNKVWLNDGDAQFTDSGQNLGNSLSFDVSLGDLDSDGDLDAFVASPGIEASIIWLNDGAAHFTESGQGLGNTPARGGALGDIDGDGDLDIFMANESVGIGAPEPETFWLNNGAGYFRKSNQELGTGESQAVALGDFNGDGNLDVFVANGLEDSSINEQANHVYLSNVGGVNRFQIAVKKPGSTPDANFYSTIEIIDQRTIPISYTLFDPDSTTMGRLAAFYSLDGGDNWQEAVPTTDTITTNLATSPYPTTTATNTHLFTWDTFASGFFGQSENVVLRFVAYPQPEATDMPGNYHYTNSLAGPYLWPYASATTFPFAVRGTQIQVYSDTIAEGNEEANAIVYRQPAGISSDADIMSNDAGQPFRTDLQGYLRGRGALQLGDQLVALLPITVTDSYTLYHTSAIPTLTGLDFYHVSNPGVQELVVSADNPLIQFDLDLSLEWDARNDQVFLEQLERDLKRTSEMLYDLTNGQVLLGQIRVHHAKENWLNSHILVYASNNVRPSADLGGIITQPVSDTLANTQVITDAYLPGQIRMSAIWNRFGHPGGNMGEDWPRTLAHELSHYLLFMPDNYLGIENGMIAQVNCQGSAMTDPYREDYSEFLTSSEWTGDCLDTLAQHTTGRTDWETITAFYQMLNGSGGNVGPSHLPLNMTQVTFIEPDSPPNTLMDPFFHITDENNNPQPISFGEAQGYLFKSKGTPEVTDDEVLAIGSPTADSLRARGAEAGDRLCLFDYSQTPRRLGCRVLDPNSSNLTLHEVSDWQPEIIVNAITSRTLAITVTQPITAGELNVQILPATHPTTTGVITAPVATMIPIGSDIFSQTITLDYPVANGFVRLWSTQPPLREEMTEFFLSGGWGPSSHGHGWGPSSHGHGWGTDRYGWGSSRYNWQAPMTTRDAQVTIFDLDHLYGGNPMYSLQSLSTLPNLPLWLTQVGQAYRFAAANELTGTLNIMFSYMERELPEGPEDRLRIYYSPDEGDTWQRLETNLDSYRNLASAVIPGEGIYTLISTIELPPFEPGWNLLPYLVDETRSVVSALASIEGYYTSVYERNLSHSPAWRLYDHTVTENHPEFSPLVNDLSHLEFGHSYFIYATDAITLYLGVGTSGAQRQANTLDPPATFYGWITPTASFSATVGMPITAWVNGTQCGQTNVQELNSQLAYKIQVSANGSCDMGEITFQVGNTVLEQEYPWDNSQAWFNPLTNSDTTNTLVGSLTLQGRPPAPSPRWSVPLSVTLTSLPLLGGTEGGQPTYSFTPTTDENGTFTLEGIEAGSYELRVKKLSTLQNMVSVTIEADTTTIDIGLLREGDANNDNFVSILDFSILASTFGTCQGNPNFDPRADFNGDSCVTILDFSLLAANFGQGGAP